MPTGIPFAPPFIIEGTQRPRNIQRHSRAGTIMSLLAKRSMSYQTHPRTAKFCEAYLDQFPDEEHQLVGILNSMCRGWSALEGYQIYHPQVDAQPGEPSNEPSEDLRKAIEAVDAQENTSLPATTEDSLLKRFIELITGEPFADFGGKIEFEEHSVEAGGVSVPGGRSTLQVQLYISTDDDEIIVRCRTVVFASNVTEDNVREKLLPGIA